MKFMVLLTAVLFFTAAKAHSLIDQKLPGHTDEEVRVKFQKVYENLKNADRSEKERDNVQNQRIQNESSIMDGFGD